MVTEATQRQLLVNRHMRVNFIVSKFSLNTLPHSICSSDCE